MCDIKELKIAVVHDWLVTNAGAEKVLKSILAIYPNADLFSLVDFLNQRDRTEIINNKSVSTSFIQKLPFSKKHFRNYLPLFPKAIESLDVSSYDLVISSSWAVAKGVKTNVNQIHICYCYTPIRYAWDLYDEYTKDLNPLKKLLVTSSLKYIRQWDIKTLNRVDYFIADSNFVKERINRIYDKYAVTIYPPVDTSSFVLNCQKEDFYLTASRLVSYKKTKLIVEAFNLLPNKKLVVIGEGEEFDSIKEIAKDNITLLGYQSKKVLTDYMQRAKAFVYAAIEDFGIVPIEAMSCGTPVIGLSAGGTKETVDDGVNGIYIKKQTVNEIINSINRFEKMQFDYKKISENSKIYSIQRFEKELYNFIQNKINQKKNVV